MIRAIGAAVIGASLAAATPAFATSAEAAANPSRPDPLRPLILDRSAQPVRQNTALILARPASPDAFGTVALNAGVTMYDARFRRVASTDARDPLVMRLAAGAANLDPVAKLRLVQQEISESVHWSHDLDNMGVADFWANAGETLRRGTGDAEDIAIAKMQVLKAAGFDPKDLYISIGRHSSRGAHILLLARTASGFFALDDKDGMIPAAQDTKFTPIMTIGQGMSWVHGRRISGNPRLASAAARTTRAK
ncbi:transglutaminase-like cysteine peptidase [Sphingomonas sp.]|uniref:transglutaminase-like cysteine peptidase n=1 Tax=Sphingomonas sp. TaxID=28214 RepID=UPI0025F7F018|nr:transglutaminase-like cysteine peptidase [Sphingomonas sp.]